MPEEMDHSTEEVPVLVGYEGYLDGQRWMLEETLLIGRDVNCDVPVINRQVSRRHAKLTRASEGVLLEDLGSKNGTHRNGKGVTGPVLLKDGDIIQIALAQKFVYLSADATLPLDIEDSSPEVLEEKRLLIDKRSRRVWIIDKEVLPPLSVSQYRLLAALYENNGEIISRENLVSAVWGEEDAIGVSEQALDALVRRLRDRLASIDPEHSYVVTVRGHGLRLDNPEI
jgi:pSer/pThr/pTyr-binding forkhead associated (FHA) protein